MTNSNQTAPNDISGQQQHQHVANDQDVGMHEDYEHQQAGDAPADPTTSSDIKDVQLTQAQQVQVQVLAQGNHEIIVTHGTPNSAGEPSEVGMKTPNSYKYPLLRQYYNFGPWIGRNRKAICLGCHLQTSSSQPDRLLKHLNKCSALSEEDKLAVQDLMNERTANKRRKPLNHYSRSRGDDDSTTEYYGDDRNIDGDHQVSVPIPPGSLRRLKRDHTDRNSRIDEALTKFIMMCRIPLKAIHSQEFVEFVRALDPDYRIPNRETITNVLIPGMLDIL